MHIYIYTCIYQILSYYPHPPYTPPHPPQPHVLGGGRGGGVGHVGLGGWGGGLGGGVWEEYRVYIDTYTHVGTKITVGKKLEILRFHLRFNRFGKFYRQIECQAGVQLIK